jgi:hypothetical protein
MEARRVKIIIAAAMPTVVKFSYLLKLGVKLALGCKKMSRNAFDTGKLRRRVSN